VRTNVEGTWRLVEACRRAGVGRFLHVISTDKVYGSLGAEGAFTEKSPLQPTSPYAASKAASDVLVLSAVKTSWISGHHHAVHKQLRPLPVPREIHPANDFSSACGRIPAHLWRWQEYSRLDSRRGPLPALDLILRSGRDGEI